MTIEERIALHEQMLQSIESNLSAAAAEIAKVGRNQVQHEQMLFSIESNLSVAVNEIANLGRKQAQFEERQTALANNQIMIMDTLLDLSRKQIQFEAELSSFSTEFKSAITSLSGKIEAVAEQHLKLEQTVERYIRLHGNGRTEN